MRITNSIKDLLKDGSKVHVGIEAPTPIDGEIAQRAGFDFIWMSSLSQHSYNKLMDIQLLGIQSYVDAVFKMSDRLEIPILLDADNGFPTAMHTMHLVREMEKAGCSGMVIENNPFFKKNSFLGEDFELEKDETFIGKLNAAHDIQLSKEFAIIPRAEHLMRNKGMEAALNFAEKCNKEANIDGFVIHSKAKTADEILEFADKYYKLGLEAPLVCIPTKYPDVKFETLHNAGFRLVICGNHMLRSATKAKIEVCEQIISEGSLAGAEKNIAPLSTIFDLVYLEESNNLQKKYVK